MLFIAIVQLTAVASVTAEGEMITVVAEMVSYSCSSAPNISCNYRSSVEITAVVSVVAVTISY